jgi:AbiV family abortive infection protein
MHQSPFTEQVIESMQACIDHAHDLLDAARLIQDSGKPNIAYHLAALALEELGRRELLALQTTANATEVVPPAWPLKHTQDHVQKMFWAFFGAMFRRQKITKDSLEEIRSLAKHIHARRKSGLYVDTDDGLNVPSNAIVPEESDNLIRLVEARFEMASLEEYRPEASLDDIALQTWFLSATADEVKRRYIFSALSMTKLAEVGARPWIEWLKSEFDAAQAKAVEIAERELARSRTADVAGTKPKWKMRIRLFSDAHSVRPKALTWWNERVSWIKLVAVPENKRQMIVEILLNDDVPLNRLWFVGWMIAQRFVAAMNLATRGLWWWHLPRQISRYYERIEDLENSAELKLERSPILKIGWGSNLVLDEEALRQAMTCMIVVMHFVGSESWPAIEFYLGGLTFTSLNEIHWQCELQAYGNFHQSLKAMMKTYGGWKPEEPFDEAFSRLLTQGAPGMPAVQYEHYRAIARAYEADAPETVGVNLTDVGFIKVLCDIYFCGVVAPAVLSQMEAESSAQKGPSDDH